MSFNPTGGITGPTAGGGGQSLTDRLQAAKHTLAGSAVGRAVCKATTEELIPPKPKHIDYLLHCTNQTNISIPQIVELLLERTQTNNWIVTFKALITIHQLMNAGNERFEACIASYSQRFQLGQFWDRSSLIGFEMSSHIRKYACYLDGKRESYRVNGFDFCRIKRGEDGRLRKIPFEKLIKIIPLIQSQLDFITSFTLTSIEIMNSIICSALYLMFKDIIKLYACYNDAMTTVLECFFDLKKSQCKEALEIYREFLIRSDNVANFLKAAENFGTQRSEIPDLKKAPESLLTALETHYACLETSTPIASTTSPAFTFFDSNRSARSVDHVKPIGDIDVNEQLNAIEDEARAMSTFEKEKQKGVGLKTTNSYNSSIQQPCSHHMDLLDLDFDLSTPYHQEVEQKKQQPNPAPIDDLIASLKIEPTSSSITPTASHNPFLHHTTSSGNQSTLTLPTPSQPPQTSTSKSNNPFLTNSDQLNAFTELWTPATHTDSNFFAGNTSTNIENNKSKS